MMWHPSESAAPVIVKGCSISKVQDNQNACHRASTPCKPVNHRALWEAGAKFAHSFMLGSNVEVHHCIQWRIGSRAAEVFGNHCPQVCPCCWLCNVRLSEAIAQRCWELPLAYTETCDPFAEGCRIVQQCWLLYEWHRERSAVGSEPDHLLALLHDVFKVHTHEV